MTRYDIWKTATPPEYDLECCDDCNPDGECQDDDCQCHATDDGDAGYDAWKDDQLTGD